MRSTALLLLLSALLPAQERVEFDRLLALVRSGATQADRSAAAERIGRSGDPRAADVLLPIARSEPLRQVRAGALVGLAATHDPRAFEVVVAALDDPNVREVAAEALGELGDAASFAALMERLQRLGPHSRMFGPLADAAFRIDRAATAAVLLDLLQREEPGSTEVSARLLAASVELPAIRERLQRLAKGPDLDLRRTALGILGRGGGLPVVSFLLGRLPVDDAARVDVVRALGATGHEFAVDPIARFATARDPTLRLAVVEALARIAHPTALDPLVAALRASDDPLVAVRAIEGLGRIGDRRALPSIALRLLDEERSDQPPRISSLWTYPWNTSVCDVAWWAGRRILEGREPCAIESLSVFRRSAPKVDAADREALRVEIARVVGDR